MSIEEVIDYARTITSVPGVFFERAAVLKRAAGLFDPKGEDDVRRMERIFGRRFMMVDVNAGVLQQVKTRANVAIAFFEADMNGVGLRDALYGYVLPKETSALIVYKKSLNLCMKRFTVVKELSHIYTGTALRSKTSEAALIAMEAKNARQVIPSIDVDLDDETAAFYLALEILVPWGLRDQLLTVKDILKDESSDYRNYMIAKTFMIPQAFVEHFCSDWSNRYTYAGLSYAINKKLDEKFGAPAWVASTPVSSFYF